MCGIVGIACSEPGRIEEDSVRRMCTLLRHRGPNDEGFFFGDRVSLGMRRLAIIDVSAGQQPMHNEDRSVWVVFNGEIYNFQELRGDLQKRNHVLATQSDTECLVHLYEEYGDDCVSKLRGMFAFAIWDDRRKRLLLARDRLGIKPLYYRSHAGSLAFASELKSLLALNSAQRQINLQALSAFFTFAYVPHPMTIYDGVFELPPAYIGTWSDGALSLTRYWKIEPEPIPNKSAEYFAEGLVDQLRQAVRLHLVSDVPLGAFLSGGIDSSAVVSLMSQTSGTKVKTFTVGFSPQEPAFDERAFAKRVAGNFGTEHTECLLTPKVEEILPDIIRAFDEPFADSSAIPNFLICRAAREWVTVALSGLGGDELFGGYERYRGALLAGHYRRVPRFLRRNVVDPIIGAAREPRNGTLWAARLKRFVLGAELDLPERYQHYIAAYDDAQKARLFSADLLDALESRGVLTSPPVTNVCGGLSHPLDQMLFTDIQTYLPDDELRKTDRVSMWNSLEVRVPFLDHKVVEFVATIPAEYKIRAWQKKHILIRAMTNLLPRTVLSRRKQGFSIPLNSWLRGPLRGLMHAYLTGPMLREVGLFNSATVAQILGEHDSGRQNHETRIWALLTFMLWYDLYMRHPEQ